MFDSISGSTLSQVRGLAAHLAGVNGAETADAERVELLRALEELKASAEALQAELSAEVDDAGQVAFARRESPHRGRLHLSLARILRTELPHTRAAFRSGRITEWRATIIARETACLSREDRATADRAIAGDPEALESYSDRVVIGELRKLAARLDPASVAERRRRAEAVAAYAALAAEADTTIATGELRSRGQVMADILVTRVTGAPTVEGRPAIPVAIGLVMTDRALLAGAHDTAHLADHGPIPAGLARELLADSLDSGTRTWLRRLYASPTTGELVAMDSHQRLFRGQLREFINLRDQFCRSAWCNAPIRHRDHVIGHATTGTTSAEDGQGLCVACNQMKETLGWRSRPRPSPDGHVVEVTTPTGHTYQSQAPPLVGLRRGAYREVHDGLWTLVALTPRRAFAAE